MNYNGVSSIIRDDQSTTKRKTFSFPVKIRTPVFCAKPLYLNFIYISNFKGKYFEAVRAGRNISENYWKFPGKRCYRLFRLQPLRVPSAQIRLECSFDQGSSAMIRELSNDDVRLRWIFFSFFGIRTRVLKAWQKMTLELLRLPGQNVLEFFGRFPICRTFETFRFRIVTVNSVGLGFFPSVRLVGKADFF